MNLHGYRYGRARFDFFPLPFSEKRRRTVLNQDSSNNVDGGDNLSCFLIKDLRTKCVFPNGLSYNSCFEPKKFEEGSVEESAQSTPPDIDLFVDTKEAEENGNPNVGFVPEKQSNKIDQKNSRIKSPVFIGGQKMVLGENALLTSHGHGNLINKSTTEIGPAKSNNLDSGNQSNSTPVGCVKEPCKVQQFSHALISMVDEWPKPILKGGIQKFTFKYNSVLVSSCDTKLMDTGKTENIGVGNPENMNNLICSKSFVLEEKCNTGKDNKDGKCFDDASSLKLKMFINLM